MSGNGIGHDRINRFVYFQIYIYILCIFILKSLSFDAGTDTVKGGQRSFLHPLGLRRGCTCKQKTLARIALPELCTSCGRVCIRPCKSYICFRIFVFMLKNNVAWYSCWKMSCKEVLRSIKYCYVLLEKQIFGCFASWTIMESDL